jgi:hypothetical protein
MPDVFALRADFPKARAELERLAKRCQFGGGDNEVIEVGKRSQAAGFYTRDDFLRVCKFTNSKHCTANTEEKIQRTTRTSLRPTTTERKRVDGLLRLSGVSWLTASALLHYGHREDYPVLAKRILWAWGFDERPANLNFAFWWAYVQASRELRSELGVTMRDLNRALWQFATDQQGLPR